MPICFRISSCGASHTNRNRYKG